MTKCNSLRSLKKRRRSVDKRSSVRKERRKYDKKILEEHQHTTPEEEETAAARAPVRNEPDKERSKESFPWWRSSTLIDFYSWCQSSVTEVSQCIDYIIDSRALYYIYIYDYIYTIYIILLCQLYTYFKYAIYKKQTRINKILN